VALERAFGWRNYSSDEFEHRIKPILVRLHSHVLAERGRSPEPSSFRGDLALLAPDAATPDGLDTRDIALIVDAIEDLG
jgi:hypothetical protein